MRVIPARSGVKFACRFVKFGVQVRVVCAKFAVANLSVKISVGTEFAVKFTRKYRVLIKIAICASPLNEKSDVAVGIEPV